MSFLGWLFGDEGSKGGAELAPREVSLTTVGRNELMGIRDRAFCCWRCQRNPSSADGIVLLKAASFSVVGHVSCFPILIALERYDLGGCGNSMCDCRSLKAFVAWGTLSSVMRPCGL